MKTSLIMLREGYLCIAAPWMWHVSGSITLFITHQHQFLDNNSSTSSDGDDDDDNNNNNNRWFHGSSGMTNICLYLWMTNKPSYE